MTVQYCLQAADCVLITSSNKLHYHSGLLSFHSVSLLPPRCANGYYGTPAVPGDLCEPCACHGNLDLSLPGSCDPITGQCLRCRPGYGGATCESCADGFYGDAITAKDCRRKWHGEFISQDFHTQLWCSETIYWFGTKQNQSKEPSLTPEGSSPSRSKNCCWRD